MNPDSPLPRATPESVGISSAGLLAFVNALDREIVEPHGLVLVRHGQVAAEGWWAPYSANLPHQLYSLTKSFTSTAVGLAVNEGLLSVDDFVVSFFPERLPRRVSKNLAAMRVRHLLSMSTGHTVEPGSNRRQKDLPADWVKGILAARVQHEPGAPFLYNSAASHLLSAIVEKVSGQPLLDYLTPRLFEPLGIHPAGWERDPQGIYTGGWGLNLRTEEIARFGLLYLNRGMWMGRQVVPAAWVDEATRKQVENGANPDNDWNQGYGYQFWRCRHNAYRGDGAFGQYCLVLPEWDAVLAMNCGVGDMQAVLNVVWERLLPAMHPAALPEDPAAAQALRERLAGLALPVPEDRPVSALASQFDGRVYRMSRNRLQFEELSLEFTPQGCRLNVRDVRGQDSALFAYRGWASGQSALLQQEPGAVLGHAAWAAENLLHLTLRQITTPFKFEVELAFERGGVRVTGRANVRFGPNELPVVRGREVKE